MEKPNKKHSKPTNCKVNKMIQSVSKSKNTSYKQDENYDQMRYMGQHMLEMLSHKENVEKQMLQTIDEIIAIFQKYDSVQLLGGIGLNLIDNLPNVEKHYLSIMGDNDGILDIDEDAEVIAEYAMNFGLSMRNEGKEKPTQELINKLYNKMKQMKAIYSLMDMPSSDNAEGWFTWMSHSMLIAVRGDGYQEHVEEVFQELFEPHNDYFVSKFGFTFKTLFDFCTKIETRLLSKVGNQNSIYGAMVAYERWKKWMHDKYGNEESMFDKMLQDLPDPDNPIMGAFIKANPDVACPNNPQMPVLYDPTDFAASEKIFWVVPQNDEEENLLKALAVNWGDNAKFIDGDYKGNIMNGRCIFAKPIIKDGEKYYCFTPMLLHRNMFTIAEALIKQNDKYYQKHFKENVLPESRDQYIERKVRVEFERFLPTVKFYSSVNYHIIEDGKPKNPELDILGISDKATYLIEVKAHELSHADRVGINGLKSKFKDSVTAACSQCHRAEKFINNNESPVFNDHGTQVKIDKTIPIYKIAITFQHYSVLLGYIKKLIELGLMKNEYRNTWVISLYDLMVISDYCDDEDELTSYLDLRYDINKRNIVFMDELDLYNGFINENLKLKLKDDNVKIIKGSTDFFDKEYSGSNSLPIQKM